MKRKASRKGMKIYAHWSGTFLFLAQFCVGEVDRISDEWIFRKRPSGETNGKTYPTERAAKTACLRSLRMQLCTYMWPGGGVPL
jgi:hypothetical protein